MTARLGGKGLGGRVRRGVTSTAIAAAAMAALTASQGPGLEFVQPGGRDAGTSPEASDLPADGNSPYHTELPPLVKPDEPDASKDLPDVSGPSESGIPATVLAAYKKAERALAGERPGCNLSWQLLAAIGKVESGQARGGAVDSEGTTLKPILGPALNGVGFAHISDTDGGAYDGDTRYDRAVGPMQFIPSTWASWGADGNGDGRKDPNNIYDAALAAGRYLCAGGKDLSNRADLERAILSYNQSREYLRTVLSWLEFYRKGVHEVPDGKGVLPESPGAGNESRPAEPSTAPDSRSKGGNGGSENGKDGQDGKGEDDGKDPSPQPTASESGSVQPKPTKTPTPLPTGPGIPTPTEKPTKPGEPTTSPTPTPPPTPTPTPTCPADPEPEPTDSEEPTASPTPTPTPTPTGTDGAEEPDESGEPGDPESPCGGPEDEDGEEGKGEDDGKKEPAPAPSASGSVSGVLGRSGE
ncbi:lytic murein transglycosylase [Streptomyces megasporus]|uniref:lytic murein transglycosylase n=1 Tax=Streptomyces megasporus TaxID=44060 RepID=UPI000998BBCE|nr:lytic murein transglycosylase [Streptomyces megasporus]